MAQFELNYTSGGILVSFIAYLVFYALFIAAQLWWAFALIATGLYCVPLLFALQRKERLISLVCTLFHILATAGIIGWTVFFFVEIFTGNTVNGWLSVYTNGSQNAKNVAKYACIAMSIDGLVTSLLMLLTAGLCYDKVRLLYNPKVEDSASNYGTTIAVNTEIDFPVYDPIPRLRTTSVGEIRGQEGSRAGWESQSARFSRKIYSERF